METTMQRPIEQVIKSSPMTAENQREEWMGKGVTRRQREQNAKSEETKKVFGKKVQ